MSLEAFGTDLTGRFSFEFKGGVGQLSFTNLSGVAFGQQVDTGEGDGVGAILPDVFGSGSCVGAGDFDYGGAFTLSFSGDGF